MNIKAAREWIKGGKELFYRDRCAGDMAVTNIGLMNTLDWLLEALEKEDFCPGTGCCRYYEWDIAKRDYVCTACRRRIEKKPCEPEDRHLECKCYLYEINTHGYCRYCGLKRKPK